MEMVISKISACFTFFNRQEIAITKSFQNFQPSANHPQAFQNMHEIITQHLNSPFD